MNPTIKFNTNIKDYQDLGRLQEYSYELKQLIKDNDYENEAASILLPFEKNNIEKSREVFKRHFSSKLKYIFILGIGGSNLGTQAVYFAIKGNLDYLNKISPKLVFVDVISSSTIKSIQNLLVTENLKPENYLIISISKSGGTTETVVNLNVVASIFNTESFSQWICITDKNSKLWKACVSNDIEVLEIPKQVGGRYSILSNVGILPLYFIFEEEVQTLLNGAKKAVEDCLNIDTSPAMHSALELFNNKPIVNEFFFDQNLEYLGKWYRQLVAESLGKENDKTGNKVNTGITPIVSIGSADLHSMLQLYLGGPDDKFTHFVTVKSRDSYISKNNSLTTNLIEGIENKKIEDINFAIYQGVKKSYIESNRVFNEVELPSISLSSLGYFLQYKMLEVIFLAKLLNVNAFDQPNVESYKMHTKQILESE